MNPIEDQTVFSTVIGDRIHITPPAANKLAALIQAEDDDDIRAIRLFVTGGGCTGMTYGMTFTDSHSKYDCTYTKDDLTIYIDSVALCFLEGVEIDYKEDKMGANFVFNNVFSSVGGSGVCGGCGGASGGGGCA